MTLSYEINTMRLAFFSHCTSILQWFHFIPHPISILETRPWLIIPGRNVGGLTPRIGLVQGELCMTYVLCCIRPFLQVLYAVGLCVRLLTWTPILPRISGVPCVIQTLNAYVVTSDSVIGRKF